MPNTRACGASFLTRTGERERYDARVESPLLQEHPLDAGTADGAIWRHSPEHPKPHHFHGQAELILVQRGVVYERVGTQTHAAHAGQLLWHLPGRPHRNVGGSSDLDLRVVHVEPDLVPDLRELGDLVAGRPVVELRRKDFDALRERCERTSDADAGLADRTPELRAAVKIAYDATRSDHEFSRTTSLVELACNLLWADPALDRPSLCRALDVSGAYLSRRFQAELGTTLQEQRTRIRVARFTTSVVREERTLLDAALRAGFGSYSQLHRVFVALAGAAPRAYFQRGGRNRRARLRP